MPSLLTLLRSPSVIRLRSQISRILDPSKSTTPPSPKHQPLPDCHVVPTNTLWVLISGLGEPRHLDDLLLCVDALRKRGVVDNHTFIFTDHPTRIAHFTPYNLAARVFPTADLKAKLSQAQGYQQVIVVVSGDGSHAGIATGNPAGITPNKLLVAVRSTPQIKAAAIILGQCYGGLFHLVDAMSNPPIFIMGATNLNMSLSTQIKLTTPIKKASGEDGTTTWSANIFLYYFCEWLISAADVDGDGISSLMDAYKYAGVRSSEVLRTLKGGEHVAAGQHVARLKQLVEQKNQLMASVPPQPTVIIDMAIAAQQNILRRTLDVLYQHQEPWTLHANLGRKIRF